MRTLRSAGKLEELTHEIDKFHWNILGLCEMRCKNFGEMSSDGSLRSKNWFNLMSL